MEKTPFGFNGQSIEVRVPALDEALELYEKADIWLHIEGRMKTMRCCGNLTRVLNRQIIRMREG